MSVTIDGSAGVTTNTGAIYDSLQRTTAVASTSGTAILFTSIPLWVKRITMMLNGVSTNGTSNPQVQIGSGSVLTSGYLGYGQILSTVPNSTSVAASSGWILNTASAANVVYGIFTIANINSNNWVISGTLNTSSTNSGWVNGSVSLSGTLDRVNITTVGGTDTFDAGTINLIYE